MAQSKPRVESEAIFVALRSLPQGSPVTVWDVALRDWPKAMMPATALRANDTFSGHVLKHPLREGQPLLSIQLTPSGEGGQPSANPSAFPPPAAYTQSSTPVVPTTTGDLWSPAVPVETPSQPPVPQAAPETVSQPASPPVMQVAVLPPQAIASPTVAAVTPTPVSEIVEQPAVTTEPSPLEPTTSAAVVDQAVTDAATAPTTSTATQEAAMPTANAIPTATATPTDISITPATEPVATAPIASEEEYASETAAVPELAAPELAAVAPQSDVAQPAATVEASDSPAPPVALIPPSAPVQSTVSQPTLAAPLPHPRPLHSRYLVVPESIAVQADASFAARPVAPMQPVEALPPSDPPAASRPATTAVRPLPSTAAADRAAPSRSPGTGTQGRGSQRQGRQSQPATPGNAPGSPTQPRLGSVMFPNLAAGIDAIEGRIRGEQSSQGQAPTAAQPRPLTTR
jgi:hypothetical protein